MPACLPACLVTPTRLAITDPQHPSRGGPRPTPTPTPTPVPTPHVEVHYRCSMRTAREGERREQAARCGGGAGAARGRCGGGAGSYWCHGSAAHHWLNVVAGSRNCRWGEIGRPEPKFTTTRRNTSVREGAGVRSAALPGAALKLLALCSAELPASFVSASGMLRLVALRRGDRAVRSLWRPHAE